MRQLIHSLVTVRIDYCNSIVYGLLDNSLYRLQKILMYLNKCLIKPCKSRLWLYGEKCFKYTGNGM